MADFDSGAWEQYIAEINARPWEDDIEPEPKPTWSKPCQKCGKTVERWRGERDVSCHNCGTEYNAFGQRLRDDWRSDPVNYDEEY